ncbi:MAG: hypothetical protein K5900_09790 [Butyrivibrio sp.]|nr:hypothetical protein [Butyrivibrio sp.]
MLKNGLLFGSFNPLHFSHIELLSKSLETFETMHVFARYTDGVDMVDWDTKLRWLETVNESFGKRLRIYKFELAMKSKQYDKLDMTKVFLECQERTGVFIDGLICGEDMQYMVNTLKEDLPDRYFIVIPRDSRSSSSVRDNLDEMKDEIPDYVYKDLKDRGY